MKILAIDTSGPICGVSVYADGAILCEYAVFNKMTHSANLLPMIDAALSSAGKTLQDMDRIACVVGPGSFTGVRIGVSTVKGLAHGAGKPCVPVDALEAMAAGIHSFDGIVCPIQDARAGQVYGAAFRMQNGILQRLLPDEPIALTAFVEKLKALGERFLFLGDGMPVHRKALQDLLGDAACFAPAQQAYLRPASVAVLAANAETALNYYDLMPLYLRAPNAEMNKKLVEAAKNG